MLTTEQKRRALDELNRGAFDERGVLKPGASIRIPLMLCDSAAAEAHLTDAEKAEAAREAMIRSMTDASGGYYRPAEPPPAFSISDAEAGRQDAIAETAHAMMIADLKAGKV